jgi:hypothetical protein
MARSVSMGVLGGATTMLARTATRRAMHDRDGRSKLPRSARTERGIAWMLVWAAAAGVIFAIADVLQEQRRQTGRST